ncbi:hypothetical protein GF337_14955 [candidate division KSB1 bacterium]|nr:hypothetical protein [candidate division KSB1 bacterium]
MSHYEIILVLQNEVEASHLESILKENKIPHFIKSYHDLAYDGLFQYQKGWGQVEAPAEYRAEILEIYNDLIKGE